MGLLLPVLAWAQGSSGIAGVVRDTTGAVLPGVTVEASSPALIEKVRSVVTDDQGLYKIVDLRPGIYTVTFALTGFSTVKREALELTTGVTATVNADLRVGALEETVTVTGQSPVVDVQNVVQQQVLTTAVLETLPNAKSIQSLAALIPGLSADAGTAAHDVGGTLGDIPTGVAIHGGRTTDQHILYDGMKTNNVNTVGTGGGNSQSIFFNPAAIQEISLEVGNLSIQSETGGVVINVIPKEGGNTLTASFLANGTNGSLQSDNLTDDLRARGVTAVSAIKNMFDLNGALGGPVVKDKLWFFGAYRRWGNENYVAGRYFSQDPLAWIPVPDVSRQAYEQNMHRSVNGRLTWQADRKNKVSFAVELQNQCVCYSGIINFSGTTGSVSPEAATFVDNFSTYMQVKWSNVVSNKLLLEAGGSRNTMNWHGAPQPGVAPDVISVTELSNNFTYRAPTSFNGRLQHEAFRPDTYFGKFAASYVTGSHAVRVGVTLLHGRPYLDTQVNGDRTYQFFNGVPTAVILRTTPLLSRNRLKADVGLYAQDQWTIKRLTLTPGLRYAYLNAYVPAQSMPAGTFVPARNYTEVPGIALWHDLTPRLGAAYDLFGNGRTALKASVSKYLVGEAASAADAKNPLNTVVNTASRAWTDADGNYVPNCDLLNPDANGECGAVSDRNFGSPSRVSTTYDESFLHGYGKRYYDWETSAGIQHELWAGVSVNATYFRRWYGNFRITDNRAVAPSDYDPFCITAPVDARLPGGGGNPVCGFYDINPAKFGLIDQFVTLAKNYGRMTDVYDGVDVTVNARLPRGAIVQGGLNTGREMTDMCDVVGKVDAPAATIPFFNANNSGALASSLSGLPSPSLNFCHIAPPFLVDVRLSGSYPLPWWGIQMSAAVQSIPGPPIVATAVVPNSQIAGSLGRNLAACRGAAVCTATSTVQLIAPYSLFGERLNQVDFRAAKTFTVNRARIRGMVDLYNLFNASSVLILNNRYGPAWQQPFVVLAGRFVKFGVQVDF